MTAEQTSMTKNRWVWIIPAAIAVLVINVAIHVLYMVAYYHFINPGQGIIQLRQLTYIY